MFYGGLIAAFLVGLWLVRRYRLPVWTTADLYAPGIALGHVIGRLGCLLAGCCYGRPTDVPWGITFTDPVAAANVGTPLGMPLHPTQLYDAGAELLILVVPALASSAAANVSRAARSGSTCCSTRISRFIVEMFRGDPTRHAARRLDVAVRLAADRAARPS